MNCGQSGTLSTPPPQNFIMLCGGGLCLLPLLSATEVNQPHYSILYVSTVPADSCLKRKECREPHDQTNDESEKLHKDATESIEA